MKRNYSLSLKLVASILLPGLFLQSCGNFSNSLTPREEKISNDVPRSTKYTEIIKQLVEQKLTAEG